MKKPNKITNLDMNYLTPQSEVKNLFNLKIRIKNEYTQKTSVPP